MTAAERYSSVGGRGEADPQAWADLRATWAESGGNRRLLSKLPEHVAGSRQRLPVDSKFDWQRAIMLPFVTMTPPTRMIAFAISVYASRDGTNAHPGVPRLAEGCDLSPRSVERYLALLVRAGLIYQTGKPSGGRGGAHRSAAYQLTWPEDWELLRCLA